MFREFYQKNKILAVTLSIVLGMLFIAVVIRPIIIGYATYQKAKLSNYSLEEYGKDVQELKTRLLVSSTNLSACADLSNKFSIELEKYLDKASQCAGSLKALEINFTLAQHALDEKDDDLNNMRNEKDAEISNLKSQYGRLAQNAANNICCKAKVDNPKIEYYQLENNKVACLEEGTNALSC